MNGIALVSFVLMAGVFVMFLRKMRASDAV